VFLAGDRAFKVKRAVPISFWIFPLLHSAGRPARRNSKSTVLCAPAVLRVIPVTREPNGALRLGGHGDVVEWCGNAPFDETRTLDRLADDNAITLPLADKLARAVRRPTIVSRCWIGAPWIAALSSYIAEKRCGIPRQPDLFDPAQTGSLDRDSRLALHRLRPAPCGARRRRHGAPRHGDLHLGNVALSTAIRCC